MFGSLGRVDAGVFSHLLVVGLEYLVLGHGHGQLDARGLDVGAEMFGALGEPRISRFRSLCLELLGRRISNKDGS